MADTAGGGGCVRGALARALAGPPLIALGLWWGPAALGQPLAGVFTPARPPWVSAKPSSEPPSPSRPVATVVSASRPASVPSAAGGAPAAGGASAPGRGPGADGAFAADKAPSTDKVPAADRTAAADEASAADRAPSADRTIAANGASAADRASSADGAPVADEAPAADKAPAADRAPGADTVAASKVGRIGRVHDNIRRAQARHSLDQDARVLYQDYSNLKARSNQEIGLSWSLDLSVLPQWGLSDGGSPSLQVLVTPSMDWTVAKGKRFGEGSVQFAYLASRYASAPTAQQVSTDLGLITAINDYPFDQDIFLQLSYTQAFPGNKVLVTIGQYPLFNFDGNQYLSNQQVNFNSYIFSQNGSSTYANAGLGAYAQVNLAPTLQVSAGLQNASNIPGNTLTTWNFGVGGYSWFAYGQWTPHFKGLGSAQYSFLYYTVPTVTTQTASRGWSASAVQDLNPSWALFARANQAYGDLTPIRGSFALGAAFNNPLGRCATDQIGLAVGRSTPSPPPLNPAGARHETVMEAYWSWTFLGGLLVTPSVQVVLDPALAPERTSSWVLALRATLLL